MADNPRVFGKYDVIRRLAVGGMGEIFLAKQTGMAGFERLVILKSLLPQLAQDPDQLSQFLDEARIVGSINHPNVVACYEVGEWEGVYFLAMEYINGVDIALLQKSADERGMRFPINVALSMTREAALGLDSAHHAMDHLGRPMKIVHRDISPHNVMVRQDGLTKIVDFGVAMASNRSKKTETGLLKGKLGYMAPEQIKGQPLDGKADQFSLGVMLWELLTQRRLFTAEDPSGVFMKIVREKVPPPSSILPDVPPEVDAVVLKMTAQEPQDRFGRLAECAAAIRKMLDLRGAMETETADLVRDLVGMQLQERIRDLTPSPVRILGIQQTEEQMSGSFCKNCGAQAVRGDRFCRSCGTPLGKTKGATPHPHTTSPVPPAAPMPRAKTAEPFAAPPMGPIDASFADEAGDLIDVAFDDASGPSERGACVGVLEVVDFGGAHEPSEKDLKPLAMHVDELAARLGGQAEVYKNKIIAIFDGNGRAARSALAFARRASLLVTRANRDLRLRAGIAALPGLSHGDNAAREDAERVVAKAKTGVLLMSDQARRLAAVAHRYGAQVQVPAQGALPGLVAVEVPLPRKIAGRASERMVIEQAIAAADVAQGQQHFFIGDAGSGKTTILDLVDAEARDRGFLIARARCARSAAMLRYDAVRQAIRSASVELNAVNNADGPWSRALDGLGLGAGDKRRLKALVDDELLSDDDIPLARRKLLLRAAIIAFFASLAEKRGVVVILDDIDDADTSSTEVFAELGARLHGARFGIFVAGRPAKGERVLPLAKRTLLEPMERADLAAVASIALGGVVPDDVAAIIAANANGSPLFAASLAKQLRETHLLEVNGAQVSASVDVQRFPVPPTLAVLSFASHALLPPESRDALVSASSLGLVFEAAELTALLAKDVAGALAAAVKSGALVDEGGGRFSFPTLSEREVAAARFDPAKLKDWHLRIAALLESRADAHGRRPIEVEERMAHHFVLGEDKERAGLASERVSEAWARLGAADATLDHCKRALHVRWRTLGGAKVSVERAQKALALATRATQAISEIDPAAAVDLAMPVLRNVPPDVAVKERAAAQQARASALLRLRRPDEALSLVEEALGRHQELGAAQRGALLIESASAHEQLGDTVRARELLQQAIKVIGEAPQAERMRAIDAMLALGRIHLRSRELPKAREMLTLALDEARRRKNTAAELDVMAMTASLEQADNKGDRAVQVLEEAAQLAARIGDGISEARLRQQAARTLQQIGRKGDAIVAARSALIAAQRLSWDEGAAVAVQLVTSLEQST